MKIEDALEVLGLNAVPDEKQLKDTYRRLVKMYHPDIKRGGSSEKMAKINEAYLYLISFLSEKREKVPVESFSISAQSLANLIQALDKYAVCPAMFRLIYDLKGILSAYYKALQIGNPSLIKAYESTIKKAYLYLRIFQKVEPTVEVLPEDIRHSFMYRLGEFLAGEYWSDLGKEVNILLDTYFKAYSLIITLEGSEKTHMPTLPSPPSSESSEVSPLGVFSAMSISGKLRSLAARLRLLLEPRVFKMPQQLMEEVSQIGDMINDLTSLVYMATDLAKKLSKYHYYGPWMDEVKAYISKIVAGAVAIGDKEVDIQSLKMLYDSTASILDSMSQVRQMAREVASLFFKANVPVQLVEYMENVSSGEIFSEKKWIDIPPLVKQLEHYLGAILRMKEEILEVSRLLRKIGDKVGCLMCPDIDRSYSLLKERIWGKLSPTNVGVDGFRYMVSEVKAINVFLDVMSLEDCEVVSGVMRGLYSEEILLRKMGRE